MGRLLQLILGCAVRCEHKQGVCGWLSTVLIHFRNITTEILSCKCSLFECVTFQDQFFKTLIIVLPSLWQRQSTDAKINCSRFRVLAIFFLRLYSNHYDPGGGRAACCHDSHPRGEFCPGLCVVVAFNIDSTSSVKFLDKPLT